MEKLTPAVEVCTFEYSLTTVKTTKHSFETSLSSPSAQQIRFSLSSMAETSRIFHTTLLPTFSQNPTTPPLKTSSIHTLPLSRRTKIRCSSISTSSSDTARTTASPQPIPWGCEIDSLENASALQKWLSESGLPPQKMAIEKVDVGERGLVALTNIRKGEKLLFVPPSLVINADSV